MSGEGIVLQVLRGQRGVEGGRVGGWRARRPPTRPPSASFSLLRDWLVWVGNNITDREPPLNLLWRPGVPPPSTPLESPSGGGGDLSGKVVKLCQGLEGSPDQPPHLLSWGVPHPSPTQTPAVFCPGGGAIRRLRWIGRRRLAHVDMGWAGASNPRPSHIDVGETTPPNPTEFSDGPSSSPSPLRCQPLLSEGGGQGCTVVDQQVA